MARIQHGEVASLNAVTTAVQSFKQSSTNLGLASAPLRDVGLSRFDFMFPDLQSADALLDPSSKTADALKELGNSMNDETEDAQFDSVVPAAYTYFGQFIAHDITLELQADEISLDSPEPFTKEFVREGIKNRRTPTLDLDCVYGATSDGSPVPRVGPHLSVGAVAYSGDRPPNTNNFNDLPRKPRSTIDPKIDREALIGDARNDQNLIVAQMHVAFLRAHNTIVNSGMTFNEARKTLVQHYQWLIIEFLKRIVDNEILNDVLTHGCRFYRPNKNDPYMPLEFSAAAFRFGHSMVRGSYDYNVNFAGEKRASLLQLFNLTSFSGELASFDSLPEKWIIDWTRFLDGGNNVARRIDTQLVDPLKKLQDTLGIAFKGVRSSLAARNLLRSYVLRIPVGQRVAEVLGFKPLTPDEITAVAANPTQFEILKTTNLSKRTPLWFYILAEAAQNGNTLGPVGSTIVTEVLIGLIRWTEDSILSQPGWKPTLGARAGTFTLQDFFRLAEVWN